MKLRNEGHEAIAQVMAEGASPAEAARQCDYDPPNVYRITSKPEFKARVEELQSEARDEALKNSDLNRPWVLSKLKETFNSASKAGKETAANGSLNLIGKELGMFADRIEIAHLDSELEGKSREELRTILAQSCSEVGMRVVDMTDDATRDFILRNAERVGIIATIKDVQ